MYSVQHHTTKNKNAQPLVEDTHMWQGISDTWTNLRDWTCECTFAYLKVPNLKVHMLLYLGHEVHDCRGRADQSHHYGKLFVNVY